jgi:thiol:disulfide interchange protein
MTQRDKNYKIIVWFRDANCVDCLNIERDVFNDPDVIKSSDRWLFVKMDTALNADRANYYLHGGDPPALVFLDSTGNEYRRYTGTFTKAEFINMLQTWR